MRIRINEDGEEYVSFADALNETIRIRDGRGMRNLINEQYEFLDVTGKYKIKLDIDHKTRTYDLYTAQTKSEFVFISEKPDSALPNVVLNLMLEAVNFARNVLSEDV